MTSIEEKRDLRAAMATARKAAYETVDPKAALAALADVLSQTTGRVSFYWPIRTEIDPLPSVKALLGSRDLCLPVTEGRNALRFRPWTLETRMEPDGFGVPVPAEGPDVSPDVLIVPLLAFDQRLQRLGYGAGHYDRTLQGLRSKKQITAIGFAYAAQEVPKVPTEPTDQPLDMIVTESGVLHQI